MGSGRAVPLKVLLGGMHFWVNMIFGGRGAVTLERGAYLGYIRLMYPLNGPGVTARAPGCLARSLLERRATNDAVEICALINVQLYTSPSHL